jgi:hypothetical protein
MCSRHDIAEILLKLALNTNQSINQSIINHVAWEYGLRKHFWEKIKNFLKLQEINLILEVIAVTKSTLFMLCFTLSRYSKTHLG